jgi:hypothetical protein
MIYSKFYRLIQKLIVFLIYKNNIFEEISGIIYEINPSTIIDIGGADGFLLKTLNLKKNQKYFCYDVDEVLLEKGRKEHIGNNIKFIKKQLGKIKIKKEKNPLILLIGVLHHVNNNEIVHFLDNNSNFKIIAIDPMFHPNQSFLSVFLAKLDKGKYVRTYREYQILLKKFLLIKKINYYLKFYSHLISCKNINKKLLVKHFGKIQPN